MTTNEQNVTIRIDEENAAEAFWSYVATIGQQAAEDNGCPSSCVPLLVRSQSVSVTAEDAAGFREWVATIPGWSDGPEYARDPFTFSDE